MRSVRLVTALLCLAAPLAAQTPVTWLAWGGTRLRSSGLCVPAPRWWGISFTTAPRTRRVHYVATVDGKGRVSRLEVTSTAAVETPPSPTLKIVEELGDTLATVIITRGMAKPDTARIQIHAGAAPFLSLSTGLLEQMTLQARRARRDSVAIDVIVAGQPKAFPNYVAKRGRDSVAIDYFGLPFYLRVDEKGRVLGANGIAPRRSS